MAVVVGVVDNQCIRIKWPESDNQELAAPLAFLEEDSR